MNGILVFAGIAFWLVGYTFSYALAKEIELNPRARYRRALRLQFVAPRTVGYESQGAITQALGVALLAEGIVFSVVGVRLFRAYADWGSVLCMLATIWWFALLRSHAAPTLTAEQSAALRDYSRDLARGRLYLGLGFSGVGAILCFIPHYLARILGGFLIFGGSGVFVSNWGIVRDERPRNGITWLGYLFFGLILAVTIGVGLVSLMLRIQY